MMPANLDAAAATLLSWLLTYAVHSTILLAIAAIAAWRFAAHHAWLDHIWKAALFAPLLTASLHIETVSFSRQLPLAAPPATSGIEAYEAPSAPPHAIEPLVARPVAGGERGSRGTDPTITSTVERASVFTPIVRRWPLIVAFAWLSIAVISVLTYVRRLRHVYRMLGSGTPVESANLLDVLDRAGVRARLTTSELCPVPLALTHRRIVLPPRFHDELDAEQQHAALAHEAAHVIRRDPEWRIAVELVERALFFQPLNRFARRRLCDSAEFLCDEWALRHTESPVALARCLSIVASWWTPADTLPAGVSAMARSESAMVQRVMRILDSPARIARPSVFWLAIPIALVSVAAPRVTATQLPVPAAAAVASALPAPMVEDVVEQRNSSRDWTAAEVEAARRQLRVSRFDRSGATLDERWKQAIADAGKRGINDFWLVYTFRTPVRADSLVISDTLDGNVMSIGGRMTTHGAPLADVISPSAVSLEGGNLAVLLHYRGAREDALDRIGYRSVELSFDFGRTPVYWIGDAPDAQSFERTQSLFTAARDRRIQLRLIDLASMHPNSDVVIPFLTRLVEPSQPADIRGEAAEGFEHHHDPRSVAVLLRVARADVDSTVRAEAAEAIGEVQAPQSIQALTDLVSESTDADVRREAAEAFGSQPAAQALPAIERVLATVEHTDVLNEAVEALGDLTGPGVVDALSRIAWEHADLEVQREAVETLGDRREDPGAIAALERIVREHTREEVLAEAIETLMDGKESSLHPLILELATSGTSVRIRKEALDAIGGAVEKISDAQELDRAQAVIERAVFDDPDRSVRAGAIDAIEQFPNDRALRMLRDIIARHPDVRTRREAEEHLRERQ
jgi:HEAT repeat protein/beta-lactamase regulating signal transducer with metallopeptidase domain